MDAPTLDPTLAPALNPSVDPALVFTIPLGTTASVTTLFAYPNIPGSSESLADTILRWFDQTLSRDGLTAQGAAARVQFDGTTYTLFVQGPPPISNALLRYTKLLPQFLSNCALGIADIATIKQAAPTLWDPQNDGWRFMPPLGLPLLNQKSAQLFHYPPMNLLNPSQDYLDDAVPTRWAELMQANGVTSMDEIVLYERLIDCAPIAASDDQGVFISPVLTPTDYFKDYQLAQFALMLTPSAANAAYTIPLIVCGGPPRAVLNALFNTTLGVKTTATVEIVPGLQTPVLGANHPYYFYAQAQGFTTVGDGKMIPANCAAAQAIMQQDLIAARWQIVMAADPSQDSQAALDACTVYWQAAAQAAAICAMVQHEGTLFYPTGNPATFTFNTSLAQGASFCQANSNNPCAS